MHRYAETLQLFQANSKILQDLFPIMGITRTLDYNDTLRKERELSFRVPLYSHIPV